MPSLSSIATAAAAAVLLLTSALAGDAPRRKRKGGDAAPADAIPQAPGNPAFPILAPSEVIQLPERTEPRMANLAARRRAILVTDGAVYQREALPIPFRWWSARQPPTPYAYIISPSGEVEYKMEFSKRKWPALPYGIAEDPSDGRVAVTFFQAQNDNIELWSHDLAMKLTYHDTSLKPSIPVFYGPDLYVPFTINDRFMEETDKILQLYIYQKNGQRLETFPRREWKNITYVHSVQVDQSGRVFAAGGCVWPWDDGVFGPTLKKSVLEDPNGVTHIEVYALSNDGRRGTAFDKERRARWEEQHPGVSPTPEMLASGTNTQFALSLLAAYNFPFPICAAPLMALSSDGLAFCACADSDTLVVLRLFGGEDAVNPTALRSEPLEVLRVVAPMGIQRIGSLTLDPSGKALVILDKQRKRVYSAAWPADEVALGSAGEAADGFNFNHVKLSWNNVDGE